MPNFGGKLNPVVKRRMTYAHKQSYTENILERLQHYCAVVDRNRALVPDMEKPLFEKEQAKEFAREAFEESFWIERVRESYKVK